MTKMTEKEVELLANATVIAQQSFEQETKQPTPAEFFKKVYNFLSDEKNWCKGALRRIQNFGGAIKLKPCSVTFDAYLNMIPKETTLQLQHYQDIREQHCLLDTIYVQDGSTFCDGFGDGLSKSANIVFHAISRYVGYRGFTTIPHYNDGLTHSQMLAGLRTCGKLYGWL